MVKTNNLSNKFAVAVADGLDRNTKETYENSSRMWIHEKMLDELFIYNVVWLTRY